MADIKWLPDGQKAFNKVMAAIPEAMRDAIKPKLLGMLAGKAAGQPVSEDLVKSWVKDDLPEPQRSALMAALGMQEAQGKKEEAAPAAAAAGWEGNSETMFERMLQEVPEMMREVFRGKLMAIANEKAQGGPIKEEHILAIVKETVPDPFKTNILKAFATMGGVDLTRVEEILESTPGGQETLIGILHEVQEEFKYVPREALVLISQNKDVPLGTLYRMVTSYSAFRLEKPKKHIITVCTSTGSHVNGGSALLKQLEAKIAQTDAEITLETARDLGCVNMAPAVMIDGEIYSGINAQAKLEAIFNE
jgi:NADH:ubiquinone oxidoreductase subunit E